MKVTTTKEAQYVSTIKFNEQIGSLLAFEMEINDKSEKRNKSVTIKANIEDHEFHTLNFSYPFSLVYIHMHIPLRS